MTCFEFLNDTRCWRIHTSAWLNVDETHTCPQLLPPLALSPSNRSPLPRQAWWVPEVDKALYSPLSCLGPPFLPGDAPDDGHPSIIQRKYLLDSLWQNKRVNTWKAMWRRWTVRRAAPRRNLRKLFLVLCSHSSSFEIAIIWNKEVSTKTRK